MEDHCAECRSSNLEVVGIRDMRRPAQPGDLPGAQPPVVARKINVRCRRCGWSDFLLRRVAAAQVLDVVEQDAAPGSTADGWAR